METSSGTAIQIPKELENTSNTVIHAANRQFQNKNSAVVAKRQQVQETIDQGVKPAKIVDLRDLERGKLNAGGFLKALGREPDQVILGDGKTIDLKMVPYYYSHFEIGKVEHYWIGGRIKEINFSFAQAFNINRLKRDQKDSISSSQFLTPELIPDPSVDGGVIEIRSIQVKIKFNRNGSIKSMELTEIWDGYKGYKGITLYPGKPPAGRPSMDSFYDIKTHTILTYENGVVTDREWKVIEASGATPKDTIKEKDLKTPGN